MSLSGEVGKTFFVQISPFFSCCNDLPLYPKFISYKNKSKYSLVISIFYYGQKYIFFYQIYGLTFVRKKKSKLTLQQYLYLEYITGWLPRTLRDSEYHWLILIFVKKELYISL
jgi:hypothetical protein